MLEFELISRPATGYSFDPCSAQKLCIGIDMCLRLPCRRQHQPVVTADCSPFANPASSCLASSIWGLSAHSMPWRSPFHHESLKKVPQEGLPPIIQGQTQVLDVPATVLRRGSAQGALHELPHEVCSTFFGVAQSTAVIFLQFWSKMGRQLPHTMKLLSLSSIKYYQSACSSTAESHSAMGSIGRGLAHGLQSML